MAALLAWAVIFSGQRVLGNVVGTFAGALAAPAPATSTASLNRPADILMKIPGLITLVSRQHGLSGRVMTLTESDNISGINLMTDTLLIGALLAVRFTAATASPP